MPHKVDQLFARRKAVSCEKEREGGGGRERERGGERNGKWKGRDEKKKRKGERMYGREETK